ncbi:alpha/beta hydrolase [Kribbella sp. NPDC048915]|uniref:alpha/beta hydrolase family protein n=1 Tax=Kribbella sp. NPDC048915 TaxID=3155148 RepID=UPI0033E348C1
MSAPGVDLVRHPSGASELVLLAHGGQEHSDADPHVWRPALLRMWPFARVARSAAPSAAVGFLRYRARGWNGGAAADDLLAVLNDLPAAFSRVVLIGHSMGGRVVVAAGEHPRVAGVLGLAPWLPRGEPLMRLRPPVTFAHGTDDRLTDPATTLAYAERLRAAGTPVTTYLLANEGHTMLRRAADWNRVVADFVARTEIEPGGSHQLPPAERDSTAAAVTEIALARLRLPIRERLRVTS